MQNVKPILGVHISNSLLKHLLSYKFWQINDKNSFQQFGKYVYQKPRLAIVIRARISTRADSPRISSPRRSLLRPAAAVLAAALLLPAAELLVVLLPAELRAAAALLSCVLLLPLPCCCLV